MVEYLMSFAFYICFVFLLKAAKIKGQSTLFVWLKDIVNHFWWCCKMADTTEQFLVSAYVYENLHTYLMYFRIQFVYEKDSAFLLSTQTLWIGITHHVCNIHTWKTGKCEHGHLEELHGKEWIQRDSKCHKALIDIILNKRWQKNVHKYLRFR